MAFCMKYLQLIVIQVEGFHLNVQYEGRYMIDNGNIYLPFLKRIQQENG